MKQDLNGVRTAEDVVRRFDLDNIKVLMDDVNGITTEVSKKVGEDEIISKINQSAEQISIQANKIKLEGLITANGGFSIDREGNMECNNAKIKGDYLEVNSPQGNPTIQITNVGAEDVGDYVNEIQGSGFVIRAGNVPTAIIDSFGNHDYAFGVASRLFIGSEFGGNINLNGDDGSIEGQILNIYNELDDDDKTYIEGGEITCVHLTQTSLEEKKKDFEKLENALEIVKNTDIYKYHFKNEKETDKKHIGFVIGENYKYRQELTDVDNKGVDLYAMASVLWRAVQEQQVEIEKLKKEVKK